MLPYNPYTKCSIASCHSMPKQKSDSGICTRSCFLSSDESHKHVLKNKGDCNGFCLQNSPWK